MLNGYKAPELVNLCDVQRLKLFVSHTPGVEQFERFAVFRQETQGARPAAGPNGIAGIEVAGNGRPVERVGYVAIFGCHRFARR